MSLLKFFLVALSCVGALASCLGQDGTPSIKVHKASSAIVVDGRLDDAWKKASPMAIQHYYHLESPTDKQETYIRILWDEGHIYFFFEAKDQFITAREYLRDGQPYFDDCGEVFLIPVEDKIDLHFGYEVNLFLTSNDFVFLNSFYEDMQVVLKAYDPVFEVAVQIDGTLNDATDLDTGWTMEMAIPIQAFRTVGKFSPLQSGAKWAFMIVRQDRNDPTGNRRSTSTLFPLSPTEFNVHDPQYFGLMEFVE